MPYHIVQFYDLFLQIYIKKSQHRITPNNVSFNSRTELTEVYYLLKVEIQIFGSLPMGVNRSNRN